MSQPLDQKLNPVVMIPARLQATRLPRKPLALIGDAPMIVQVWRRAQEAGIGPVYVATDSIEIAEAVSAQGGQALMTREDHQSGSDRIFEALNAVDPNGEFDAIVNLQGDLPTLDPQLLSECLKALDHGADIATLAAEIIDPAEKTDPNVVKVVGSGQSDPHRLRALYFTRATAPFGDGPLYHHIGIYAYRRAALARFVGLAPSPLEKRERLEQLRALEADMRIDVAIVDTVPLGVDTPHDLDRARLHFAQNPLKR